MIDNELHQVDALCVEFNRPRFLVTAVSGAESPHRLSRYIRTADWDPIDARVKVTQVESVVSNLGGKELYGDSSSVALRELIANAADSIRARVTQFGGSNNSVVVRLWQAGGDYWLSVSDSGIGMDENRLVNSLTDFGKSTWTSPEMLTEYPGLVSKKYRATGKFGIGFFSVFMLSDYVEVTSLKYLDASDKTARLIFKGGIGGRPMLQRVPAEDRLHAGGATVKIKLRCDPLTRSGLLETDVLRISRSEMLKKNISSLCALSDTDIAFSDSENGMPELVVAADSWKTAEASDLFRAVYAEELQVPFLAPMYREYEKNFVTNSRVILSDDGDIVGRAVLAAGLEEASIADLWWWPSPSAPIFVGGLRADILYSILGVFVGEPGKADRKTAFPSANAQSLRNWAETQATSTANSSYASTATRYTAAQFARSVGVDVPTLPLGYTRDGELTPLKADQWAQQCEVVYIISSAEIYAFHNEDGTPIYIDRTRGRELDLPGNAVIVDLYPMFFFPEEVFPRPKDSRFAGAAPLVDGVWNPEAWWYGLGKIGSAPMILEAVARAWDIDAVSLGKRLERHILTPEADERISIETKDGSGSVKLEVYSMWKSSIAEAG
ncbi:ATP-binding protein [Nocardia pseudovaccinii]|uniref:ATP-binding protein n=1 Tax=Nocardia pseudovaccinii TaxID=189540 RepID=UPI0009FE1D93|nr:ATP-binding protein [Nocardia pseudovaccinii]